MSTVQIPYADPGKASFEVLDTYTQAFLLAGNQPELSEAIGLPQDLSTTLAQFAVVGRNAGNKIAMATNGDDPAVPATGALTFSGTGTAADTVTINGVVYTLVAAPAVANDVKIGASAAATALNIIAAINGAAGSGVTYGAATTPHPDVSARSNASTVVGLAARVPGAAGNAITTTEAGTGTSFGAATLTGGLDEAGVKAIGVVAHASTVDGSGGNVQVFYQGCFNQDALVWDASFDTDAKKQAAFIGSPTPTQIIVRKR
jgi:hypothetical protein